MNHRVRGFLIASLSVLALQALPALAHCGEDLGLWHLQPGFAVDFASPVGLLGLWRAGSGDVIAPEPKVPAANLSCPVGVPCLVNHPGDGRSIRDFERYELGGNLYYALAFTDVESYELLLPYLTDAPALAAQLTIQKIARNRLVDFETFDQDGQRRWAALFQEGVADQQLDLSISTAALEARVENSPAPGVAKHLVDFEVLSYTFGSPYFAALFDEAPIDQVFFANLSVEEFHVRAHELRLSGFYLADVETWVAPVGGDIRFAAVFEESSGDDHLYVMACGRNSFECNNLQDFDTMCDHLSGMTVKLPEVKPSLRLIDIELTRSNSGFGVSSFGQGALPAARQGRLPALPLLDPPIYQVPPTCTHAGVLHDSGTNGPP